MADADRPADASPRAGVDTPARTFKPVPIERSAGPAAKAAPVKSDLATRIGSAVVMVIVSGIAFRLGGWWWVVLIAAVGFGVLTEWAGLVFDFVEAPFRRGLWLAGGLVYVGVAAAMLVQLRLELGGGMLLLPMALIGVVATDVGGYFVGRTLGGPKIASRISPSKTWSGLAGGATLAALAEVALTTWSERQWDTRAALGAAAFGGLVAIVAQSGDFFESWMKRRAGVKDSGNLIPGHGGLLDRLDGLLAVMFVLGLLSLVITLYGAQ
jgi:phosphatidate cytidylyltransferase